MKVSVIVPVFNEKDTFYEIIQRLQAIDLPSKEIIIVDDGSTDGTDRMVKDARRFPDVKAILHGQNGGKGAAVKTGLLHSTGEVVIIQDADLEYNPEEIKNVLYPILKNQSSVCYGSRLGSTFNGPPPGMDWPHFLANKFLTFLTNVVTKSKLTDMETCFKAFHRDVLNAIGLPTETGFNLEPELTIKTRKAGFEIHEVPIKYKGRTKGEGKKISFFDGVRAIGCIFRHAFR